MNKKNNLLIYADHVISILCNIIGLIFIVQNQIH